VTAVDPNSTGNVGASYQCPGCGTWVYGGAFHVCGLPVQPWPNPLERIGWNCPHCHKAHPPWVSTCPEPQQTYSITTTGSP
jgi:hypothetical protein